MTVEQVISSIHAQVAAPPPRTGDATQTLEPVRENSVVNAAHALSAEDAADLKAAIERINTVLQDFRRDLVFSVDEPTGRTIVQVVEPSSGEVLRQIPSREVLQMAAHLEQGNSLDSLGEDRWV